MNPPSHQALIRLPLGRLSMAMAGIGAGAAVCVAALVRGLAGDLVIRDGLFAAGAVLAGVATGILFLMLWGRRPVFTWGALVIAGSMIRMVVSTAIASAIYLAQAPDKLAFWMAFLAGSFAAMAQELAIVMPALRAGAVPTPTTTTPTSEPLRA